MLLHAFCRQCGRHPRRRARAERLHPTWTCAWFQRTRRLWSPSAYRVSRAGLHVVRTRSADHGVAVEREGDGEGAHTPRDHGDDAPASPIKPAPMDAPAEAEPASTAAVSVQSHGGTRGSCDNGDGCLSQDAVTDAGGGDEMEVDPSEGADSESSAEGEDNASAFTWEPITDEEIQDGVRIWHRVRAEIACRHERYEASIEGLLGLIEPLAQAPAGARAP